MYNMKKGYFRHKKVHMSCVNERNKQNGKNCSSIAFTYVCTAFKRKCKCECKYGMQFKAASNTTIKQHMKNAHIYFVQQCIHSIEASNFTVHILYTFRLHFAWTTEFFFYGLNAFFSILVILKPNAEEFKWDAVVAVSMPIHIWYIFLCSIHTFHVFMCSWTVQLQLNIHQLNVKQCFHLRRMKKFHARITLWCHSIWDGQNIWIWEYDATHHFLWAKKFDSTMVRTVKDDNFEAEILSIFVIKNFSFST